MKRQVTSNKLQVDAYEKKIRHGEKGMTLVEMLISLSVFSLLVAIAFTSISTFSKSFTETDAINQMKSASQKAVNKIGLRLSECKRIFENTAQDTSFLARITGIETPLSGSRLYRIEETGSSSPGDPEFNASSVGNALFFASMEFPEVFDLSPSYKTRIDVYVFNYYYLAPAQGQTICSTPAIKLLEWHSKKYADFSQLNVLTGNTKTLTVQGFYNRNIRFAWDPAALSPSSAFYILNSDGTLTLSAAHTLIQDECKDMTRFARGIAWGRYRAGISPNTGGAARISQRVPSYGQASNMFPSGFEVVVTGPRSAHRILVRTVFIAQGASSMLVGYENMTLSSARNLW